MMVQNSSNLISVSKKCYWLQALQSVLIIMCIFKQIQKWPVHYSTVQLGASLVKFQKGLTCLGTDLNIRRPGL